MRGSPVTSLTDLWRRALVVDLATFNVAVFFLAWLPPSTLILPEWLAMVGSSLCFVGLISHASRRWHLPGEQWSYLLTAWVGVATLLGFVTTAHTGITYSVAVPMFLLSGVASAGAAHIIDGGEPRKPAVDG